MSDLNFFLSVSAIILFFTIMYHVFWWVISSFIEFRDNHNFINGEIYEIKSKWKAGSDLSIDTLVYCSNDKSFINYKHTIPLSRIKKCHFYEIKHLPVNE